MANNQQQQQQKKWLQKKVEQYCQSTWNSGEYMIMRRQFEIHVIPVQSFC